MEGDVYKDRTADDGGDPGEILAFAPGTLVLHTPDSAQSDKAVSMYPRHQKAKGNEKRAHGYGDHPGQIRRALSELHRPPHIVYTYHTGEQLYDQCRDKGPLFPGEISPIACCLCNKPEKGRHQDREARKEEIHLPTAVPVDLSGKVIMHRDRLRQ